MDNQNKKAGWMAVGALGVFFAAVAGVNYFDPLASAEKKFVEAAESGNIQGMDKALTNGADIKDWAGRAALLSASKNGELDAVKHLLTLNFLKESYMYEAAAKAAEGGHNDVLEFFISEGLDVNQKFKYGLGLLESATRDDSLDTINLLLQHNIDVTNPDTRPTMALGYALQEGYTDIVRTLLDAGMDVQAETYRGNVLSGAVSGGFKDIVELAFERGADITAENHDASRKAAEYGRTDILDILLEHGGSVEAANEGFAIRSARRGDIDGFKEILQRQPEVLQTVGGWMMGTATYNNNKKFVEMLIEEGVISAENMGSALIFAAQDGNNDILEILLSQNANFKDAEYDPLNSALFYTTQNNQIESIQLLLAHGADPRVNAEGYSPINMTERNPKIAKLFADYLVTNSATPTPPSPKR